MRPCDAFGNELKTFGAGSTRKRLDTFGMTVDDMPSKDITVGYLGCAEPTQVRISARSSRYGEDASLNNETLDSTNDSELSSEAWDLHGQIGGDEGSETAGILQTRTYAVTTNKY